MFVKKWLAGLALGLSVAVQAAEPVAPLPKTPSFVVAFRGVKQINDDVKFLLELPLGPDGKALDPRDEYVPEDTYDLFMDFLSLPWTAGLSADRPVGVQIYSAGGTLRSLLTLPIAEKSLIDRKKGKVLASDPKPEFADAKMKKDKNLEMKSGFDGFLVNLSRFDLKIRELGDGLYRMGKSGGFLRSFTEGSITRATLGGEEGDVKVDPITEANLLKELLEPGDLIAAKWNGRAQSQEEKKKNFVKFRKESLDAVKEMEGESKSTFLKRVAATEKWLDVMEEFLTDTEEARFGAGVDRKKVEAQFRGTYRAFANSELSKMVNQLGDIPSAFAGVAVKGSTVGAKGTFPLTTREKAFVEAQAEYATLALADTLELNKLIYVVDSAKVNPDANKKKDPEKDNLPKLPNLGDGNQLKQRIEVKLALTDEEKKFLLGQAKLGELMAKEAAALGIIDALVKTTSSKDGLTTVTGIRVNDGKNVKAFFNTVDKQAFGAAKLDKEKMTVEWTVPASFAKDYKEIFAGKATVRLALQEQGDKAVLWMSVGASAEPALTATVKEAATEAKASGQALEFEASLLPLVSLLRRQLAEAVQYEYPPVPAEELKEIAKKKTPQRKPFLGRSEREALAWAERYLTLVDEKKYPTPHLSGTVRRNEGVVQMEARANGSALSAMGRVLGYYFSDALQN